MVVICEDVATELELLELLDEMLVVLVALKVALRNAPNPTTRIKAITIRAETPNEIALFGLANAGSYLKTLLVLFENMQ